MILLKKLVRLGCISFNALHLLILFCLIHQLHAADSCLRFCLITTFVKPSFNSRMKECVRDAMQITDSSSDEEC